MKITFEDHGQDFLTFTVDKTGQITDVFPFQFSIWSKYRVTNMKDLKVNGRVNLEKIEGEPSTMTIRYPIAGVHN